jgi:hypothetical protein
MSLDVGTPFLGILSSAHRLKANFGLFSSLETFKGTVYLSHENFLSQATYEGPFDHKLNIDEM